jgi:hypothetical protein
MHVLSYDCLKSCNFHMGIQSLIFITLEAGLAESESTRV